VLVPKYSETRLQENLLKFKLLRARQKPYLGARMVQLISRSAKTPWNQAFSRRGVSGRLAGCPKRYSSLS
ncbi:MAG: hypothetical protein ACI9NC_003710, partial [Verrucomicrobiales bacterium]